MSENEAKEYAPECYACPIGTVSMAMQKATPDASEHLIKAGREMLAAVRSMLDGMDAFLGLMEERGGAKEPEPAVEAIPIRRTTPKGKKT